MAVHFQIRRDNQIEALMNPESHQSHSRKPIVRVTAFIVVLVVGVTIWIQYVAPWVFSAAQEHENARSFSTSLTSLLMGFIVSGGCALSIQFLVDILLKPTRAKEPPQKKIVESENETSRQQRAVEALQYVADQKRNLGYVLRRDDANPKAIQKSLKNLISIAKYCKLTCTARLDELRRYTIADERLRDVVGAALQHVGRCDDIENELTRLSRETEIDREKLQKLGECCLKISAAIEALLSDEHQTRK